VSPHLNNRRFDKSAKFTKETSSVNSGECYHFTTPELLSMSLGKSIVLSTLTNFSCDPVLVKITSADRARNEIENIRRLQTKER